MAIPGAALAPRRALLAGAAAVALGATAFAAHDAQAAFTLARCQGSPSVRAQGASFQSGAHTYWRTLFENSNGCDGTPVAPVYRGNGSGNGIASMGGQGGSNLLCADANVCTAPLAAGVRDALSSLAGTDEPLTAQQLASIDSGTASTADDGRIHQIPIAVGSSALLLHAPEGCNISTVANLTDGATGAAANTGDRASNLTQRIRIPNVLLEKAFAGDSDADTWGEIAPGISGTATGIAGGDTTNAAVPCANVPVRRVVRPDNSGTTYGWKAYLRLVNPARGWLTTYNSPDNRTWPAAGGTGRGTVVSGQGAACTGADRLCASSSTGGGALATAVAATDGSIGYADLVSARSRPFDITPSATTQDYVFWSPLQNNPGGASTAYVEPTFDATAHSGAIGAKGSNCQAVPISNAPTPAASPNNDPTFGDWSGTYAAGGSGYPACVLTYALAWDDNAAVYGSSQAEQEKARTVKDYLATIVGPGQAFTNVDYSPLPNSIAAPLLQYAQNAVAAIDWNKTAGGGGEVRPPETRREEQRRDEPRQDPPRTAPSNAFSIPSGRATASLITYTVQLPGAGTLKVAATARVGKKTIKVASLSTSPKGAAKLTLRLKLSAAAKKALAQAKSKKLTVRVAFTFTPTGGTAKSQTKTVTVKAAKPVKRKQSAKR